MNHVPQFAFFVNDDTFLPDREPMRNLCVREANPPMLTLTNLCGYL